MIATFMCRSGKIWETVCNHGGDASIGKKVPDRNAIGNTTMLAAAVAASSVLANDPTSVTNIVDRLEADGLVKRTPHPTDRRTTLAEITDLGRDQMKAATAAVTAIDFGLRGLTDRQTASLTELLSRVRKAAGDFTD